MKTHDLKKKKKKLLRRAPVQKIAFVRNYLLFTNYKKPFKLIKKCFLV